MEYDESDARAHEVAPREKIQTRARDANHTYGNAKTMLTTFSTQLIQAGYTCRGTT